MPLPQGFKIVEGNDKYFEVPDQYGQMKMFPFNSDKNGVSTVTISGSGLNKWGFDEKAYPKTEGTELVGVAVFKDKQLIGVTVGEVSKNGNSKTVTLNHIVHNDGSVEEIKGNKPPLKLTGEKNFSLYPEGRNEVVAVTNDYTMARHIQNAKKEYVEPKKQNFASGDIPAPQQTPKSTSNQNAGKER